MTREETEYTDIKLSERLNIGLTQRDYLLYQGWGIATRKVNEIDYLYVSDGSGLIKEILASTLEVIREIKVFDESGNQITWLNELEIINYNVPHRDFIFANEFLSTMIHMIRISDG